MINIDLRSDTLTQPTPAMHQAMFEAKVGDDVYGEDPTVNALQGKAAEIFGMEAALFCPSGTMCNQIGIRLSTQPQSEVICDKNSHIYLYEAGGIAANSQSSVRLIAGDRGRLNASIIEDEINPFDSHFPITSLVSLENTANRGGGSCYQIEEIEKIYQLCQSKGIRMHLDGARLFNALVATGQDPKDYGRYFDTISICLSKGLGAAVGSVLLCSKKDFQRAQHIRKLFGGGMRQAGYIAAGGLYALNHHIERLAEDHQRARILGDFLSRHSGVEEVFKVETNIIVFKPSPVWMSAGELKTRLAEKGIKISGFGKYHLRMVTHLDISDEMVDEVLEQLKRMS